MDGFFLEFHRNFNKNDFQFEIVKMFKNMNISNSISEYNNTGDKINKLKFILLKKGISVICDIIILYSKTVLNLLENNKDYFNDYFRDTKRRRAYSDFKFYPQLENIADLLDSLSKDIYHQFPIKQELKFYYSSSPIEICIGIGGIAFKGCLDYINVLEKKTTKR
jgi:hypothetical protein